MNQFVSPKTRDNVAVNKSWFTLINLTEENRKDRKKIRDCDDLIKQKSCRFLWFSYWS